MVSKKPSPLPVQRTEKKNGRPTVRTEKNEEIICDAIARGTPYRMACSIAHINYQTFLNWRRDDPAFQEKLDAAIARGVQSRLDVIERAMLSTDENIRVRVATWWLEHVLPSDFSRSRIEVEAVGTLEHSFVIPQQTLNDIAEARARMEQKQNEQKQLSDRNGN